MIDSEPNQAGDRRTTILFNTTGRDSFPVYLNLLHTLQGRLSTRDPKFTITVSTQPLPRTVNEDVKRETAISFFVAIAFAFIPTSYVSSLVKEASTKAKHLQLISGVSQFAFWTSIYTWDFLSYLIPGLLSLVVFAAFNVGTLVGSNAFAT
eukprot:1004703_1